MTIGIEKSKSGERVSMGGPGVGLQLAAYVEVLLLGLWLGSMAFFAFAVPQTGFAVLPSRQLVGLMVTGTITKAEWIGLVLGPLLVLIQVATWRARREGGLSKWTRLALLVVMTGAAALSRFWVTPAMVTIRETMGAAIEDPAWSGPLRDQFNYLHGYSTGSMMVALSAGLVALFLAVRSWLRIRC